MKGKEAAVNALATRTAEARDVNPEPHIRNTRPVPKPGDVVASRATARSDNYTIRILPDAA
jgi:exosome complex RNA-binding protein Csl4